MTVLTASLGAATVQVELEGLEASVEESVRARTTLAEESDGDLGLGRIQRLHELAPEEIRQALRPFGYYHPSISATLEGSGDDWTATYDVEAGPPVELGSVDLVLEGPGTDDPGILGEIEAFPLEEGDRLLHSSWEKGKNVLLAAAAARGYLDAELLESRVEVDLERNLAEARLRLSTGPRYRFGEVEFRQELLDPVVLRGYVTFQPGDPYDPSRLRTLHSTLARSPYFAGIDVVPKPEEAGEDLRVPIEVRIEPARPRSWRIGAGWGSDTGPRLRLELDLRRINRKGHRGEVDVELSDVRSTGEASYVVPGAWPRTDAWRFSLGREESRSVTVDSRTDLVSAGWSRSRSGWREAYSLSWRREDYEVGPDRGDADLVVPEASWSRVSSDDRVHPSRGLRLRFDVAGASGSVLSDASFLQAIGEARIVRELFGGPFRFLGRLELGWTETDRLRDLPPSYRFFAGGVDSVRGYEYQEIGRLGPEGRVIGGSALSTASVELDALLIERWGSRWGLGVFWDVGSAENRLGEELKSGVGGGLRWLSPVGLVRLDVGVPLDEARNPYTIHLSLGPDL